MRSNPLPRAFALLIVMFVVGCAAFTQPQTFDQRWVYARESRDAVVAATADALAAHRISSETAREIRTIAGRTLAMLEAARELKQVGDLHEAEAQLMLARMLLQQLDTYLAGREP